MSKRRQKMNFEEVLYFEKNLLYVSISDYKFSVNGEILKTTLGSCVSVVLYSKHNTPVSSMSHFLLPFPPMAKDEVNYQRYGSMLIPIQIKKMEELGVSKKDMIAKVTGGAAMFPIKDQSTLGDIGEENSQMAFKVLKENNINLMAHDTGGTLGRSIEFHPKSKKLKVTLFGKNTFYL